MARRAPSSALPANPVPEPHAYLHPQFTSDPDQRGYRHHHTKSKGDTAEVMVLAAFAVHGFVVSRPFSENAPYDLIVDDGTRLAKVQVKHARFKQADGYVHFTASSANQYGYRRYSPRTATSSPAGAPSSGRCTSCPSQASPRSRACGSGSTRPGTSNEPACGGHATTSSTGGCRGPMLKRRRQARPPVAAPKNREPRRSLLLGRQEGTSVEALLGAEGSPRPPRGGAVCCRCV